MTRQANDHNHNRGDHGQAARVFAERLAAVFDDHYAREIAPRLAGGSGQPDPLAHVRPGDDDPTHGGAVRPFERAERECGAAQRGLVCTREPRHPGQHIAGDTHVVHAAWDDDTTTTGVGS